MASFAQLDENNKVLNVIKVSNEDVIDENGIEREELGIQKCKELVGEGTKWVQTWFGPNPKRVRPARVGGLYLPGVDAFVDKKPYESWVLDPDTYLWQPPTFPPTDIAVGYYPLWDEDNVQWVIKKVTDPESLPQPEEPAPEGKEYFWNHDTWAWDTRDKPAEEVVVDVESEEVGDTPALDAGA